MKQRWVFISAILLVTFSIVCLSMAVDYKYVGSAKSNKYHSPNCKQAQKISPANLVKFKSAEEAQKSGYIPCNACKPPTKD